MLGENCALLDVSAPPSVDGYGDATAPGAVLWTGRVAGHLRRRRVLQRQTIRATSGALSDPGATLVEIDQLIVRPSAGGPAGVLVQPGDSERAQTVLVEDRRTGTPAQRRFRVTALQLRAGSGIADSILVSLADDGD